MRREACLSCGVSGTLVKFLHIIQNAQIPVWSNKICTGYSRTFNSSFISFNVPVGKKQYTKNKIESLKTATTVFYYFGVWDATYVGWHCLSNNYYYWWILLWSHVCCCHTFLILLCSILFRSSKIYVEGQNLPSNFRTKK